MSDSNTEKYNFLFHCCHWISIVLIILKPSPSVFIGNLQPNKAWNCFTFYAFLESQNGYQYIKGPEKPCKKGTSLNMFRLHISSFDHAKPFFQRPSMVQDFIALLNIVWEMLHYNKPKVVQHRVCSREPDLQPMLNKYTFVFGFSRQR